MTATKYCSCEKSSSSRHESSQAVICTDGRFSSAPSIDGHSDSHVITSTTGVTSCLRQKPTNTVCEAAVEDNGQDCTSAVTSSLASLQRETDVEQLTCVVSAAVEVKRNNNSISGIERHCAAVCEDSLSAFFASPATVSSLSAKLKAAPRRKAVTRCKCGVTSDSCDACYEHKPSNKNSTQCTLRPHDALTSNCDEPAVCADVTNTVDKSSVCESSSVRLSSLTNDARQGTHLPFNMCCSGASSGIPSSGCLTLPESVSVLPSSGVTEVVPSDDHMSACLRSTASADDHLHLRVSPSVALPAKCAGHDATGLVSNTTGLVSKSSVTQPRYCEKPLPTPVKNSSTKNQQFLYPSVTGVYRSPVGNVFDHSSSDAGMFQRRRSKPVLYSTPAILKSVCVTTHSTAEERMKEAASTVLNSECSSRVKETMVDVSDDNAALVSTSRAETGLLAASDVVSCGLHNTAATSVMNTTYNAVNANTTSEGHSVSDCAVVETYCDRFVKTPSQDVRTECLTVSLPSLVGSSSKLTCDFSGQTSPRITGSTTLCDVAVQTGVKKLASEDTRNVSVNAAVQTVPASCCTCVQLNQSYKNRHRGFSRQESHSVGRNNLWQAHDLHDAGYVANAGDVNSKLIVPNMDTLSVSDANKYQSPVESPDQLGDESGVESHYNEPVLCDGATTTVNTTCMSSAVNSGNRCTMTVIQGTSPTNAVIGELQCVISNESSVEYPSSVDAGDLHAIQCETLSAGVDCLKTVASNCARVTDVISLKSTNVSLAKSFSTGFISAGGKPLNVKLSSKLNACKLLDDLDGTEGDSLKNATIDAYSSNTDYFPEYSGYNRSKLVHKLATRMDTGTLRCDASELVDTSSDNMSSDRFTDKSAKHMFKASESSCAQSGVYCKSSSLMTNVHEWKSANRDTVSACDAAASSPNNRVADVMYSAAKQSTDGFKPFKAPRTSMMSSKHARNELSAKISDERLPSTNVVLPDCMKSSDKGNDVGGTELLDLTNTQRAEVMDASRFMLNSAELFVTQLSDDVNELAAEKMVSHNNAGAFGSSCECASNPNILTSSDSAPTLCSSVYTVPTANTERVCDENQLTELVNKCSCDEADTDAMNFSINKSQSATCTSIACSESETSIENSKSIQVHSTEHNPALCLLTANDSMVSSQERDTTRCCNMPTMDAGLAETKTAPVVSVRSGCCGETGSDQVAFGSCINTSCKCATENQNASLSLEETAADDMTHKSSPFVFFSGKGSKINVSEKTLRSVRQNWNKCATENQNASLSLEETAADDMTHKSTPFVFFSGKGNKINVSEKTLCSVRQNWQNYLTRPNAIGVDSRTMMKVTDVNEPSANLHSCQDFSLHTDTEEMHAGIVVSDIVTCHAENGNGDFDRIISADEADENSLSSVPMTGVHPADVDSTSVVVKKVSESNAKSIHTVSHGAVISNGSISISPDTCSVSCLNTSVHVSYAKAAEHRLPFKASDKFSNTDIAGDKQLTDRNVLMPLSTVPASKCD